jgi:hypothetical protein
LKKLNKLEIPFFFENLEKGKMLLVKGMVNNSAGYFIIDTGASCTIIDSSLISESDSEDSSFSTWQIKTIEGNNTNVFAVKVEKFELSEILFPNENFFCTSLHFLNKEFPKKVILGIIGNDFMEKYSAVIDFREQKLLIKKAVN